MLLNLFKEMRAAKVPVSVRELLDLIDALKHRVVFADMDEFYYLARTIMVKDERHFDKFDRAFGAYFKGLEDLHGLLEALIPDEWLRHEFEKSLTPEDLEKMEQRMTEIVERSDVGIDLHTASDHRTNLPQIRGDMEDEKTAELAAVFGAPLSMHSRTRTGSVRKAAAKTGATVLLNR